MSTGRHCSSRLLLHNSKYLICNFERHKQGTLDFSTCLVEDMTFKAKDLETCPCVLAKSVTLVSCVQVLGNFRDIVMHSHGLLFSNFICLWTVC